MTSAAGWLLAASVLCLGSQNVAPSSPARAALEKLAERLRDARFLSARVVQSRRTDLLEEPITSSGMLYYRRQPAQLVFQLSEPRKAEIHLDQTTYQVYRPEEHRLEVTDFGKEEVSAKILMVFEPKPDALGKTFAIEGGESKGGQIEIRLESSDERVRKRLRRIVLTLSQADHSLRRLSYVDGEGDTVTYELSDVTINPELSPELFSLKVPPGTRVLRHSLDRDK